MRSPVSTDATGGAQLHRLHRHRLAIRGAVRCGEKFGPWRVEEIHFTRAAKEMLAGPVRTTFEDRNVRIPDDELFIADLRMIQKETVGDHVRFVATDDNDEGDSHADRFWALALMLHAGKTNVQTFGYEPLEEVANRRGRRLL